MKPPFIPVNAGVHTKSQPEERESWKDHRPFPVGSTPAQVAALLRAREPAPQAPAEVPLPVDEAVDQLLGPEVAPIPTPAARLADIPAPAPARKDDSGKIDVTLVLSDMPHAILAVAEVCQWAITKKLPKPYVRGSWLGIDDFFNRYRGAQGRHMLNAAITRIEGSVPEEFARDGETGLLELAHNATNAMFLLEKACRKLKGLE